MGRLIDANRKVHIQIYDDEHEEFRTHEMSIADALDAYTDEGCPDAEPSVQQWIPCKTRLPEDLEEVNVTWVNHKPESYTNL